ncbi:restriction endonuclease [Massilimicrobiota sp. An142]|uniref:restriction endonuclease n=1 Tax=Massilimicrobiota TaxID=1924110 RepID=UPI000B388ACF|nr:MULTISPECIES: restriction endonuclease [Massilimicrobiota]OUQ13622.1 restriction endonuclease [Massilimicrobiota sp. An142]OUQ84158.1 restriction endonuclease [Massilimicrobiota sp. An105]
MAVILKNLSSDEKVAYLYKPILIVLQEAGGKLDRSEIKSRISDLDEQIAEFAEVVKTSKSTGNTYKEFNFKFNFAIKELSFVEYLSYTKGNPNITLTDKGLNVDIDSLDVNKEIMIPAKKFWNELSKKNKKNEENKTIENDVDESMSEDRILNDFKENLLRAIANMSPKKFEAFSRALLTKMGVEFTNKGVQISNDGGIDGYGYHRDQDDFRTTRVVIQCKRYNTGPVTEPDINQFLGAMNKFQADYGVFITNSRFTNSARIASREGSPITLIDGNDLVDLVIRYQLYITPVTTYVLDDFYNE